MPLQGKKEAGGGSRFTINLDKASEDEKLGVAVVFGDKKHMLVKMVDPEGMIPRWNAQNSKQAVCKGDLLLSINGVRGDTDAMGAVLKDKTKNKFELLVWRADVLVWRAREPMSAEAAARDDSTEVISSMAPELVGDEEPALDVFIAAEITEAPVRHAAAGCSRCGF